ncbi:unnamed protein product, partial [Scytosiphon promiscuus]
WYWYWSRKAVRRTDVNTGAVQIGLVHHHGDSAVDTELRYHRGLGHHSPPLSHLTRDAPTYPHGKAGKQSICPAKILICFRPLRALISCVVAFHRVSWFSSAPPFFVQLCRCVSTTGCGDEQGEIKLLRWPHAVSTGVAPLLRIRRERLYATSSWARWETRFLGGKA